METKKNVEERVLKAKSGMGMLIFSILLILLCAPVIVVGVKIRLVGLGIVLGVILVLTGFILLVIPEWLIRNLHLADWFHQMYSLWRKASRD